MSVEKGGAEQLTTGQALAARQEKLTTVITQRKALLDKIGTPGTGHIEGDGDIALDIRLNDTRLCITDHIARLESRREEVNRRVHVATRRVEQFEDSLTIQEGILADLTYYADQGDIPITDEDIGNAYQKLDTFRASSIRADRILQNGYDILHWKTLPEHEKRARLEAAHAERKAIIQPEMDVWVQSLPPEQQGKPQKRQRKEEPLSELASATSINSDLLIVDKPDHPEVPKEEAQQVLFTGITLSPDSYTAQIGSITQKLTPEEYYILERYGLLYDPENPDAGFLRSTLITEELAERGLEVLTPKALMTSIARKFGLEDESTLFEKDPQTRTRGTKWAIRMPVRVVGGEKKQADTTPESPDNDEDHDIQTETLKKSLQDINLDVITDSQRDALVFLYGELACQVKTDKKTGREIYSVMLPDGAVVTTDTAEIGKFLLAMGKTFLSKRWARRDQLVRDIYNPQTDDEFQSAVRRFGHLAPDAMEFLEEQGEWTVKKAGKHSESIYMLRKKQASEEPEKNPPTPPSSQQDALATLLTDGIAQSIATLNARSATPSQQTEPGQATPKPEEQDNEEKEQEGDFFTKDETTAFTAFMSYWNNRAKKMGDGKTFRFAQTPLTDEAIADLLYAAHQTEVSKYAHTTYMKARNQVIDKIIQLSTDPQAVITELKDYEQVKELLFSLYADYENQELVTFLKTVRSDGNETDAEYRALKTSYDTWRREQKRLPAADTPARQNAPAKRPDRHHPLNNRTAARLATLADRLIAQTTRDGKSISDIVPVGEIASRFNIQEKIISEASSQGIITPSDEGITVSDISILTFIQRYMNGQIPPPEKRQDLQLVNREIWRQRTQ